MKTLAETKKWKNLIKEIKEARKDSKFMSFVKEFVKYHSGATS